MQYDIRKLVESSLICQKAKGVTTNVGLYQPLPIQNRPWESINMDFVMGLPMTQKGYNNVFVVVDRYNKMAHFPPCKSTNDASHVASIFLKDVVRIHWLPLNIVSKRDAKFVGHFWRILWKKLDTNLIAFSSSYHPQIDGQDETINRSLKNILRCLTKKHGQACDMVLPQAKFAYNDPLNRSTCKSPFQIVYGMTQRGIMELKEFLNDGRTSDQGESFAEVIKDIHEQVKSTLQKNAYTYT